MRLLSLFSRASSCSLKHVVVKTLIQKSGPLPKSKKPRYPIWVIYPQVGNHWCCL